MVTRASGSAIMVSTERMAVAMISSRSVNPRTEFARGWNLRNIMVLFFFLPWSRAQRCESPGSYRHSWRGYIHAVQSRLLQIRTNCTVHHLLLNGYRRLRPVDCDGLQARIARPSASDGQGSLAILFCQECDRDHRALAGNSCRAGWTRSRNLRLADSFILAMRQRYDLAILREEAAIGHVHQLKHFRVIVELHRHRMYVLCAGKKQVHYKCVALGRLDGWWIKQEAGRSSSRVRSRRLPSRGLVGHRLNRRICG